MTSRTPRWMLIIGLAFAAACVPPPADPAEEDSATDALSTAEQELMALATRKACMLCHRFDKKVVGPGFREIARKYARVSGAEDMLVTKVLKGGRGNWGAIPMPPNENEVRRSEATTLVRGILALSPSPEPLPTSPTAPTGTPLSTGPEIAKERLCLTCHAIDRKVVGPSFRAVAGFYAEDPDAFAILFDRVKHGNAGVWDAIPMPANPQISDRELGIVLDWILTLKP